MDFLIFLLLYYYIMLFHFIRKFMIIYKGQKCREFFYFLSSREFFRNLQCFLILHKKNQSYQTVFLFVFRIKRIYLSFLNISKILIVKILVLFLNPLYTPQIYTTFFEKNLKRTIFEIDTLFIYFSRIVCRIKIFIFSFRDNTRKIVHFTSFS